MSIKLMTTVWENSPYEDSALLLHLALADFANDEGYCWPSIKTLAKKIRRSSRQVSRLISTMVEDKTLQRIERVGTSNLYIVTKVKTWNRGTSWVSWGDDTHDVGGTSPMSSDPSLNHHDPFPAPSARPLPEEDEVDQLIEELRYVDLDEEEGVNKPKWQIPDTLGQREFLRISGAKWFKSGQKSKVKALLRAFHAGDLLGDRAYAECARSIEDVPDFSNRELPPLPRSWYDWRAEQAKEHRWSADGFIKALYNRDALMRHCQIHMKKSDTAPAAGKVENGVYIIEIPEGGPR